MKVGNIVILNQPVAGIPVNSEGIVTKKLGNNIVVRITTNPDCTPNPGFTTPPIPESSVTLGSNCSNSIMGITAVKKSAKRTRAVKTVPPKKSSKASLPSKKSAAKKTKKTAAKKTGRKKK